MSRGTYNSLRLTLGQSCPGAHFYCCCARAPLLQQPTLVGASSLKSSNMQVSKISKPLLSLAGFPSGRSLVPSAQASWADECARRDPAKGRILYGVAGNCCVIAILLGLAIGGLDNILNVRHYIQLGAICFFTGVFQLWAYVGAVKPILSEIVPRRLTGQTLAYAAGIDGAIASILGAPVLAAIAQELFHYQPTELMINDMSRTLRINNLLALSNAYFTVVLVSMVAATILFAALVQTYQYDKEASLKEDNENEQSTLIDQQSTPDKQI